MGKWLKSLRVLMIHCLMISQSTASIHSDFQIRWLNVSRSAEDLTFTETISLTWTSSLMNCVQICLGNAFCVEIIFSRQTKNCRLQGKSLSGDGIQIDADDVFYKVNFDTSLRKINPASCTEIKECSKSSDDEEFWLFPEKYDRQTAVKVFCHNMTQLDTSPTEYVTLPYENYFFRFDNTHLEQNNAQCTRNLKPLMKTVFSKIRLNIQTMTIIQNDFTFVTTTGISLLENVPFGTSSDCTADVKWYTENGEPCDLYGKFQIDLQGTGVSIANSVTWEAVGFESEIRQFSRSSDSTKVSCLVLGFCGECKPSSAILVEPIYGSVVDGKAKSVTCQ